MSSPGAGDGSPLYKRNRERISIRNLTLQQPTSIPSASTSFASPSAPHAPFLSLSNRTTSGGKGYQLTIMQEPVTGAAHGAHYLSRVPLAPALIIRLDILDRAQRRVTADDEIPFFVTTIQLLDENAVPVRDPPDDPINTSAQPSAQRLLYGSLVSSPYSLVDLSGQRGLFFIFPDVSVRVEGKFRLGVSLTRLRDHEMTLISSGYVTPLAQIYTQPFTVVNQGSYVAPASTQLSLHFRQQGAPRI
ncbi:hypothetical protein FRC14_005239 [Serendipita sp. 396]|nr:hypothetical protein FRC14_005239 [Serendipita sp. 396]KAG8780859.1 hypothetical protein FRC15_009212 [Serendipita sp. 397]KAG8797474.1 hypothetical protein FRC16_008823 [Serendipita sp. 398]KAG8826134.1 hypothetical protein FRC19_009661 [Serendipita sp. 401]KAG8829672.1 hypothetical protein FRC18_009153 [Serendipita sp. 400]KAG8851785.1 hypothetical protein FRB91_007373 [Serendipita sp. 411]KAG8867042.1 hypothetical protein FRC20_006833 [Serendipita sp. 405]KAG9056572.1 hypothetical prot